MKKKYEGENRRKFKRVKVSFTVVYHITEPFKASLRTEKEEISASIVDISKGGAAVITHVDIPEETVLWVNFDLTHSQKNTINFYGTIEILGEVKYRKKIDEQTYRLGISFLNMRDMQKHDIAHFLEVVSTQKPPSSE